MSLRFKDDVEGQKKDGQMYSGLLELELEVFNFS